MHIKHIFSGMFGLFLVSQCGNIASTTQESFSDHAIRQQRNSVRDALIDEAKKAEQDSRAWLEMVQIRGCVPVLDKATQQESPFLVGEPVFVSQDDPRPLPPGTIICNGLGYVGEVSLFDGEARVSRKGLIVPKHRGEYDELFNAIKSGNFEDLE